eukprot:jgi/Phyca11/99270/e_gw1.3.973.1
MKRRADAQSFPLLASRSLDLVGRRASSVSNSVETDEIPAYWASTRELSVLGVSVTKRADRSALLPQTDLVPISTVLRNLWATESTFCLQGKQP